MKKLIWFLLCLMPLTSVFGLVHKVGEWSGDGSMDVHQVVVVDHNAYLATQSGGLHIISVANPSNPVEIGSLSSIDTNGIAVVGDFVYITDSCIGLVILNISDPCHPNMVGYLGLSGQLSSILVVGNTAYVLDHGLEIVDVSNPENPQLLGTYSGITRPSSMAIMSSIVYLSDSSDSLQIVDVSNPQAPLRMGTCFLTQAVNSVSVCDSMLYVAQDSGLTLFNLSDPTNPTPCGSYTTPSGVLSLTFNDHLACLAEGKGGAEVVDVANAPSLQSICFYDTPGIAVNAMSVGGTVFVADDYYALQIADFSNLNNPYLAGNCDIPGCSQTVVVNENIAYVVSDGVGLNIVDLTNPQAPQVISTFPLEAASNSIALVNGMICVAEGEYGVQIVDVSNPYHPQLCSIYNPVGLVRSVCSSGATLLVGMESAGMQVVDLSSPNSPRLVGNYDTNLLAGMATIGATSYIARFTYGLSVLDLSDMDDPLFLGSCEIPGYTWNVVAAGTTAYITGAGVNIVDASDPVSPVVVGQIDPFASQGVYACFATSHYLFLCDRFWNKIDVYNISNPLQPQRVLDYSWNCESRGIYADGQYLYTANSDHGLSILDLSAIGADDPGTVPTATLCLRNFPNPFNPTTTIAYSLPNEGKVTLSVYNLRGQLVKQLVNESQTTGEHKVLWNGTNNSGQTVASGVYFYRLATAGRKITGKMLMIK